MNKIIIYACLFVLSCFAKPAISAETITLENFVRTFNYETRTDMKCTGKELLALLAKNEAVLIDIRFPEEQRAWGMGFAMKIPLSELPDRLKEIPKDKIIVTACPHIDRSNIAMVYLRTQGYNARYLVDGLVGFAELLRGDMARNFIEGHSSKK